MRAGSSCACRHTVPRAVAHSPTLRCTHKLQTLEHFVPSTFVQAKQLVLVTRVGYLTSELKCRVLQRDTSMQSSVFLTSWKPVHPHIALFIYVTLIPQILKASVLLSNMEAHIRQPTARSCVPRRCHASLSTFQSWPRTCQCSRKAPKIVSPPQQRLLTYSLIVVQMLQLSSVKTGVRPPIRSHRCLTSLASRTQICVDGRRRDQMN
jgi:hypothetical protein